MDAKLFAEKYKGRQVLIYRGVGVNSIPARIVGHALSNTRYVVVEPIGGTYGLGWPRNSGNGVQDAVWLCDDALRGYYVTIDSIALTPQEALVPPQAYPHRCKRCQAPARIVGKSVLCSNDKCKSWKLLDKTYKNNEQGPRIDRLSSGRIYYLNIWLAGGCVLCGERERGGTTYAHHHCWSEVDNDKDRYELQGIIHANRV